MVFPSAAAMRELVVKEYGAIEGAVQTFDRLGEHLEKTPIVVEQKERESSRRAKLFSGPVRVFPSGVSRYRGRG